MQDFLRILDEHQISQAHPLYQVARVPYWYKLEMQGISDSGTVFVGHQVMLLYSQLSLVSLNQELLPA